MAIAVFVPLMQSTAAQASVCKSISICDAQAFSEALKLYLVYGPEVSGITDAEVVDDLFKNRKQYWSKATAMNHLIYELRPLDKDESRRATLIATKILQREKDMAAARRASRAIYAGLAGFICYIPASAISAQQSIGAFAAFVCGSLTYGFASLRRSPDSALKNSALLTELSLVKR